MRRVLELCDMASVAPLDPELEGSLKALKRAASEL
jgi:hypothetical protein